jgi:hypothetical protein
MRPRLCPDSVSCSDDFRQCCNIYVRARHQRLFITLPSGGVVLQKIFWPQLIVLQSHELAPRSRRYYESDVRTALNYVGLALLKEKSRSLDIVALRRRPDDEARPWDENIARARTTTGCSECLASD